MPLRKCRVSFGQSLLGDSARQRLVQRPYHPRAYNRPLEECRRNLSTPVATPYAASIEFFTANIRNPNTRAAYGFAVVRFADRCEMRGIALAQLTPVIVAAYLEELGQHLDKPSVKQHLAALRMLFDYLVTGQVLRRRHNRRRS